MVEGQRAGPSDASEGRRKSSQWTELLRAVGARLVPLVVSASALLGFIAFAGAVIVWTRFFAVKVPPDQVVTAVPRSELIATGSSLLLLFGFFGVLAVLTTYLVDRGGRATPGMARGLLALLVVEGIVAIVIKAGWGSGAAWGAIASFLLPLLLILVGTFLDRFTAVEDTLPARERERGAPRPRPLYSKKDDEGIERLLVEIRQLRWISLAVALVALVAPLLILDLPRGARLAGLLAIAGVLLLVRDKAEHAAREVRGSLKRKWVAWEAEEAGKERREKTAEKTREQEIAAVERAVRKARRKLRAIRDRTSGGVWPGGTGTGDVPAAERRAQQVLRGHEEEARKLRLEDEVLEGAGRRDRPRSYNLQFKVGGMILGFLLAVFAVVVPAVVLDEFWVAGALVAAVALTLSLWRIAALPKRSFHWFGLAVFVSVPLFGTLTLMARNLDDPQVQPVALIRSTDGPDEAIQGLYVTEGHDRVYFATVATEGCTEKLLSGTGRLLWVPKEEVVAMSVGPLQSVGDAARASLEMAYALTPAVETPSGTAVSLRAEAEQAEAEALADGETQRAPRLENTGPAVRRTFGLGISLEPESAAPNDMVTLRMSAPDEDVGGFGATRMGRNLRVGGVPAAIVKGEAMQAERSEFVKTAAGEVLALDKEGLYGWSPGEEDYAPWEPEHENAYVRLDEESGVVRTLGVFGPKTAPGGGGASYLQVRLNGPGTADEVVGGQEVELRDGEPVNVGPVLLRQAWGENSIRFRVPENATTGAVEVECEQLAGQPLLQIERPPEASVSARMLSSGAILLDSRGSSDDGEIVTRHWSVNDKPRFQKQTKGKKAGQAGRATAEFDPPRRLGVHHVQLTVEDDDGETDTANLYLVRVPGPGVAPDAVASTKSSLVNRVREDLPTEVQVAGHARAGSGGDPYQRSRNAAKKTIRQLLNQETAKRAQFEDDSVAITASAFGARCGLLRAGAAQDLHVDIFLLTEGFRLSPPRHCRHQSKMRRTWTARASSGDRSGDSPARGRRRTG